MADCDEEEFEPELPGVKTELLKRAWDDEDVEEKDVKESWEDEDDDTNKAPKKESVVEKKSETKIAKADAGKKAKDHEAKTIEAADVLGDPVAEKHRQQRLVEEADYKSTTELFATRGDEKSVENFIPKSEQDFAEYAELLSHKVCPYEKSYHYIALLKAVMRLSMTSLKAADAKEIASSVTAIANEKLMEEKDANAGKKKQSVKKQQLHVDKPDDDIVSASYDDDLDD